MNGATNSEEIRQLTKLGVTEADRFRKCWL
jgi:hypothetical protein